jgi:hypothetical protein
VVSSEPCSSLVSLLRSFNPDFLFCLKDKELDAAEMVLEWLNVRPLALIKISYVEIIGL